MTVSPTVIIGVAEATQLTHMRIDERLRSARWARSDGWGGR
jgi:hypothetical protein